MFFFLLLAYLVLNARKPAFGAGSPVVSETDSLKAVLAKPLKPADKIKTLAALGKAYYNQSDLDNALKTEYQLLDVVSQHALGACDQLIVHARTLLQCAKTVHLDGGEMCEDIASALIRFDEAKTLGVVEPFDSACGHAVPPS